MKLMNDNTIGVIGIVFGFIFFGFWVSMFVSLISNKNIKNNTKILWIICMLALSFLTPILYYFGEHRKDNSSRKDKFPGSTVDR